MEPLTIDTALANAESDIARINAVAAVTFDDPDDEDEDEEEPVEEKGEDA